LDDPPTLASGEEDEESALDHYRRVRDEISSYVANLPKIIMDIS
jgi:arsenate reductase